MNEEEVKIPIGYSDIPSHKLFTSEPPKFIYHYTDLDGASGIIQSKSLWLTKLSYLNDKTELKLAIDLFRAAAANYPVEHKDVEKKEFLAKAAHQLQAFENTNICVASFCENGDLLSQWRSYGNDGNGIALQFNAVSLKKLSNSGVFNVWRCIYLPSEQKQIIDGLIHILLKTYDVISINKDNNQNWETTKNDIIGYFNTTFLRVAPVIKNRHFYEEQEWRIITIPIPNTDNNWFSRVSNSKVAQYYSLHFDLIDEGAYEFINGAIVGPTPEPGLLSDALMVLLSSNGYKYNQVSPSQIPYRK